MGGCFPCWEGTVRRQERGSRILFYKCTKFFYCIWLRCKTWCLINLTEWFWLAVLVYILYSQLKDGVERGIDLRKLAHSSHSTFNKLCIISDYKVRINLWCGSSLFGSNMSVFVINVLYIAYIYEHFIESEPNLTICEVIFMVLLLFC
jgi:hypothetical protein